MGNTIEKAGEAVKVIKAITVIAVAAFKLFSSSKN